MRLRKTVHLLTTSIGLSLLAFAAPPASGQPYLGQIQTFGFDFCPRDYIAADGQLLLIEQNQPLFSLFGFMYGHSTDQTLFAVPDLSNRVALGSGTGPGLIPFQQGEQFGSDSVTLDMANLPPHSHSLGATTASPTSANPTGLFLATFASPIGYAAPGSNNAEMNYGTIGSTGGGQPFSIKDPVLGLTMCVSTAGTFPPRG